MTKRGADATREEKKTTFDTLSEIYSMHANASRPPHIRKKKPGASFARHSVHLLC